MTSERWMTYSLAFQLTNIDSELARAESLERQGDELHRNECLLRALDLVRLTVQVQPGFARKQELNRLTELLGNIFEQGSIYQDSITSVRRLLQPFASQVAKERGM